VDELYDYAYEQVVRRTPKQTPGKWSYKQQGDIVLRENLKPRDVKPAPLPSELLEMLSHPSSSVRRAGIQDLISLLDGKHLGLARAAQEKLREIAENDDSLTLRKTANETLITRGLSSDQPAPYPIEISKEKSTEGQTTSSTEKKTELEDLLSQAIQYELKGDFWNALQIYYKIKRIDPIFPRVDIKIQELERELRPKPTQTEIKPVPQPKIDLTKFNPRLIGLIVGALFVITLSIWGGEVLLRNINRPSSTQTSIPPNPAFDIGSTMTGKDGMTLLYVPAGEFTMGSENGASDEKPVHKVILKAFWIDKTEVTNAMYAKCVQEGNCDPPNSITSQTRESYFDNTEFAGYPVVYVSWDAAAIYCSWAERRLPTEAEWEKAASWDEKNQIKHNYPWGDSIDCSFAFAMLVPV